MTRCAVCRETGYIQQAKQDIAGDLSRVQAEQREDWLKGCNLPKLFLSKTFENFERNLQPKAFDFMRQLEAQEEIPSLVLLSPDVYGVGKTHLIAAFVNFYIANTETASLAKDGYYIKRRLQPIYFISENSLLSRIRQTYNRSNAHNDDEFYEETEEDVYEYLLRHKILIIDDVGKIRPHDYSFLQSVYFRIIDYRYSNAMSIILTSNLGFSELEQHIGGASADRLREMCGKKGFISMTGKSYRKGLK